MKKKGGGRECLSFVFCLFVRFFEAGGKERKVWVIVRSYVEASRVKEGGEGKKGKEGMGRDKEKRIEGPEKGKEAKKEPVSLPPNSPRS